jgi:hypothetical protein
MLGHLRLRDAELLDEVVHGTLAAGERVQDLPPTGLGHRVERIRRGRRSCHGAIIYRYWNIFSTYRTAVRVAFVPLAPSVDKVDWSAAGTWAWLATFGAMLAYGLALSSATLQRKHATARAAPA